jgi:DNA segregation ATPase FtsK/SpoIIIE-like protein
MSVEVTKEFALSVATAIGGNAEFVIRDLLRQLEPVPCERLAQIVAGSIAIGKGYMISNETRLAVMRALNGAAAPVVIMPPAPGLMAPPDTNGAGKDDPLYQDAVNIVRRLNRGSISLVQRHLRISYNRAAHMLEAMHKDGIVSPAPHGGYLVSPAVDRKKPDDTEGGAA